MRSRRHYLDSKTKQADLLVPGRSRGVGKLDTFIGFRGPGRTRVHWRNSLRHLAIGVEIFVIKGSEELGHRPRLTFRRRPVDLVRSLAMITAGIRFYDAGIDGERFTLDQTRVHARSHHCLEYLAKQIAVAKPAVAIG